jgi:hypothetical protein
MLSVITRSIKVAMLPLLGAAVVIGSSCNKNLDVPAGPTALLPVTGLTLANAIAANPNDSLFSRLIVRSGQAAVLNNAANEFTLFAVDNAGMKLFVNSASGGAVPLAAPDATFSAFIANTIPVATAAGIIQYLTLPQKVASSQIPTTFPNLQRPTMIKLDPTNPLVVMSAFPSKNSNGAFFNNVPITSPIDVQAANGIIHHIFTVSAPPTALLKGMIASEPTLSYLRAAITRADSGQVGLNRFDSALNFGVANLTVFAPNDVAFQGLIYNLVFGQVFTATGNAATANTAANNAVAAGPVFLATNNVTTTLVRGIVAYHLMGVRVFNCNMSSASLGALHPTLLNGAIAAHPGVRLQSSFTGPFASAFTATGLGTFPPGGIPFSGAAANGVKRDQHGVNGVYHIIDRVLLPQ